jgi:hypothetical protein
MTPIDTFFRVMERLRGSQHHAKTSALWIDALRLVVLCLAMTGFTRALAPDAEIRFANDDRLTGSLESFAAERLVWISPALEKPTPFELSKILELRLPGNPAPVHGKSELVLNLTNGDVVRGGLAMVNDKVVALETLFGGRMEFNRAMIADARIEASSEIVYRGPTGLDGWRQTGDSDVWTYGRSSFRSSGVGGIGRDDLLPDVCSIAFDAEWKGDACSLKVVVFSENVTTEPANSGYELTIQRGNFRLKNCASQNYLGSGNAQVLVVADKAHFEIRANRRNGTFCLFINERIAEVWTDTGFKNDAFGNSLQFVSLGSQSQRVSAIRVSKWDGVVDGAAEARAGAAVEMQRPWGTSLSTVKKAQREDGMRLANGDFVAGELTAIENGLVVTKTRLGEVKLPVERLRTLALRSTSPERAIRRNGDIRVYFTDGSHLVFRLDAVDQGRLVGSSQNFGRALFGMDSIERIEFNIYDPALEPMRSAEKW